MDLELKNKKVLVTGGTRGIGKSIAECFINEGARVSICSRDSEQLKSTLDSLSRLYPNHYIYGHAFDVSDTKNLKKWINASAKELEGIDIYVSNVSAQSFDWQKSFDIDLLACINGIEEALPFLKKSNNAAIVSIASKAAMLSVPSYKAYSAMKAALISYISALSREYAPFGIRANCVSPGEVYFKDGFWDRIKKEDPDLYKKTLACNPMDRFGTPEEIAKSVLFLSSSAASFISGANLVIDGASHEHVHF